MSGEGLALLVTELLVDGDGHSAETRQRKAGLLHVSLRELWSVTPTGELVPVMSWPAAVPA